MYVHISQGGVVGPFTFIISRVLSELQRPIDFGMARGKMSSEEALESHSGPVAIVDETIIPEVINVTEAARSDPSSAITDETNQQEQAPFPRRGGRGRSFLPSRSQSRSQSRSKSVASSRRSRSSSCGSATGSVTAETKTPNGANSSQQIKDDLNTTQEVLPNLEQEACESKEAHSPRRSDTRGGNKSIKRNRDIINRESHRTAQQQSDASTKQNKSSSPMRPSVASVNWHDDVSSINNLTADGRSVRTCTITSAAKSPEAKAAMYSLSLVVLLIDINSRRFELLQLQFDSEDAKVSDILLQVPESATIESLRNQSFDQIVTADGEGRALDKKLVEFCDGCDLLVAIPAGLSPQGAVRLAKPILANPKIYETVRVLLLSTSEEKFWVRAN